MKPTSNISARYALIFLMVVTVFGCKGSTPPVTFYTLTPIPAIQGAGSDQTILKDILIGIGPLKFPKILDRPQIVTRPAPGKLDLAEFKRWGGFLKDDFLSVMAENMMTLLGTDQVVVYPWPGNLNPSYRIEFDVYQFDGKLGDSVVLRVSWILKTPGKTDNMHLKKSTIVQPVSGDDFDALVAAKSKALEAFSHMIIEELKKVI
jgi:uncharacterized lipoprotein YmbA